MGEKVITTELELLNDYRLKVRFDGEELGNLTMDEPPPVGSGSGPNPAMLISAAVGGCLTESLLFCLRKSHADVKGMKTKIITTLKRNERGRLRIGAITIELKPQVDDITKLARCREIFEDYCVVTESVKNGIPVEIRIK